MSDIAISKGKILFVVPSPTTLQLGMRKALKLFGWEVQIFCWDNYIKKTIWRRLQYKYLWGPAIRKINQSLIKESELTNPDIVLIWKGISIWPGTIDKLKKFTHLVISYYADNPFGNYNADYANRYKINGNIMLRKAIKYEKRVFLHRHVINFIKAISSYDIHFVPRMENIEEYKRAGAKEVHLLYRYYTPEFHHPTEFSEDDLKKFGSDVTFIGHFEPDHRTKCLESLVDAGINVRLFGTGWNYYLSKKLKDAFGTTIRPLYGNEYVKALCASKMAICFMSKLNKDTSTTRCFEIPACGTLLLSERTDELKELYKEDKEAVYFSDKDELVKKVKLLLREPEKRKAIAASGHERCLSSGYDVVSRLRIFDRVVSEKLNILHSK